MKDSQILCTLVVIAVLESGCSACLITNCPKGGKRSLGHGKDTLRQSPRCGPAKTGHCYGADICCGVEMGCVMATVDTLVCQREQMSPEPCVGPTVHVPCGRNGKCAAPGVCCTPDSCTIDSSCLQTMSQEMANRFMYNNVGNMLAAGQISDVYEK